MCVWRCRDGTCRSAAGEFGEEGPLPHAVAMRAAHCAHEGDLGCRAAEHGDGDGIAVVVARFVVVDRVGRLRGVAHEVGRDEDLDAIFLGEARVFGVGAGDEHTTVE